MRGKKEKMRKAEALAEENRMQSVMTDPFGMYTGDPADLYEKPVQDADDL